MCVYIALCIDMRDGNIVRATPACARLCTGDRLHTDVADQLRKNTQVSPVNNLATVHIYIPPTNASIAFPREYRTARDRDRNNASASRKTQPQPVMILDASTPP